MRRGVLSRTSQIGIAAMSYMAEVYGDPDRRVAATDIAKSRQLQTPYVRKVLTTLSRANLIEGTRGPGGGFRLVRPPEEIALKEITDLFDREDDTYMCPYGKNYCGTGPRCPLHDQITLLNEQMDEFLETTTLAGFTARDAA